MPQPIGRWGMFVDQFRATAGETGTTNCYYMAGFPSNANTSTTPNLDQLYAMPFWSGVGGVIKTLALNVNTVGGAGAKARIGVYSNFDPIPLPNRLLLDGGADLDCNASTGLKTHTGLSLKLDENTLYWFVVNFGTAAPQVFGISGDQPVFGFSSTQSAQFAFTKSGIAYASFPLPTVWPVNANGYPSGNATSTGPGLFAEFSTFNRGIN